VAIDFAPLYFAEFHLALFDSDSDGAAGNCLAPARCHISKHDRILWSKLYDFANRDIVHKLYTSGVTVHFLDQSDLVLSNSRHRRSEHTENPKCRDAGE